MPDADASFGPDCRESPRVVASTGTLPCPGDVDAGAADPAPARTPGAPGLDLRFRTVFAGHARALGEWLQQLDRERRLSPDPTFRSHIRSFRFEPPAEFRGARSLVVAAVRQRLLAVRLHLDDGPRDVLIPAGHANQAYTGRDVRARLLRDALGGRGLLQRAALPLEALAVRSGLAQYGRNHRTYAGDLGSLHELWAYWTDRGLTDHWQPFRMMRMCKGCAICEEACPTQAFPEARLASDSGRCPALHGGPVKPAPDRIPPAAPHAPIGCLRCQYRCPANADRVRDAEPVGELDAARTRFVLGRGRDPGMERTIMGLLPRVQAGYPHFAGAARRALAGAPAR